MADITIIANPSEPRSPDEVESAIEKMEGVRSWSLDNGVVTLIYDDDALTIETITDALMPIGYSVKYPM